MKNNQKLNANQTISYMYKAMVTNKITIIEWWAFIKTIDPVELRSVTQSIFDASKRLENYKNSSLFINKIRAYVNVHHYTDIEPYEVVETINNKTVLIRKMNYVLKTAPIQHVGGFSAITENSTQEWEVTQDLTNPIVKLKLHKAGWGHGKYFMSDSPCRFYDYNF